MTPNPPGFRDANEEAGEAQTHKNVTELPFLAFLPAPGCFHSLWEKVRIAFLAQQRKRKEEKKYL